MNSNEPPVALITGAARRIGAGIARHLHAAGFRVAIHCHHSKEEAGTLAGQLNEARAGSAIVRNGDLADERFPGKLVDSVINEWQRLDLLVNNASRFYPTPFADVGLEEWNDLFDSNLRAPFLLAQAAAGHLAEARGSIVNIIDIHGERPLRDHAIYSTTKAGLHMLTRALAKELAPAIRVNGVSPGAILWPETALSDEAKQGIIDSTPLARQGSPRDIAEAVLFLARGDFITGQVIAVDGGRSL